MPKLEEIRLYFPPADRALSTVHRLARKCYENKLTCLILGSQKDMDALDRQLWLSPRSAFLPHGMAGNDHDLMQPILLQPFESSSDTPHLSRFFNRRILFFSADIKFTLPQDLHHVSAESMLLVYPTALNLDDGDRRALASSQARHNITVLQTTFAKSGWSTLECPGWLKTLIEQDQI